jgi:hypothetical protein
MRWISAIAKMLVCLWLALAVVPSRAQRPPTNDVSDRMGNTGGGTGALTSITTGGANTAYGNAALRTNTTGGNNTAVGTLALSFSNTGNNNTGVGSSTLEINGAGDNNTAVGSLALNSNITGNDNTGVGAFALENNTGGTNTAVGFFTLGRNTTGSANTAVGDEALESNNTGGNNTAVGLLALGSNTSGSGNTVVGENALVSNTTGSNNIALGFGAGFNLISGSDNIYLGAASPATESKTMRLGEGQTSTFVAGIASTPLRGSQVVVTNSGQLGILASSARYKRDIQAMGARSRGLFQLRPVTFRYKQDPQGIRQYGLVAEEVAKVYPDLVTRGSGGAVESVQYNELIPMLLNELQRQGQELRGLKAQNWALAARLVGLEEAVLHSASLASR